jgi:hypothetical protein
MTTKWGQIGRKSSIAGTAGRASVSCRLRRLQASPRRRRLRPRSAENAVAQRCFAAHLGPRRLLPLRRAAHRSVAGKLPRRWSTGTRPAPLRSATTIAESSSSRSGSSVAATLEIGAYAMRRRREVWRVGAVGPIGVGENSLYGNADIRSVCKSEADTRSSGDNDDAMIWRSQKAPATPRPPLRRRPDMFSGACSGALSRSQQPFGLGICRGR